MQITTERLILREFHDEDWRDILRYQLDPEYLRFYAWDGRGEDDVRAFVAMFTGWRDEEPRFRYQLAIVERADPGRVIGNCGVRRKEPGSTLGNIGAELAPEFWGRGYATEALRAIIAFAFHELRLHRVWSTSIAGNRGAAGVVEKLGLKLEGRLREQELIRGEWHDVLLHGLLEREWRAMADDVAPSLI